MKSLTEHSMLGRYAIQNGYLQIEFQIGTRLVWVRFHSDESETDAVNKAELMFKEAWADIPVAIELAEQTSRMQMPEFWSVHDRSNIVGNRLNVWGVALTPKIGEASYDIFRNHEFDFNATFTEPDPDDIFSDLCIAMPDIPDNYSVTVIRNSKGNMHVKL